MLLYTSLITQPYTSHHHDDHQVDVWIRDLWHLQFHRRPCFDGDNHHLHEHHLLTLEHLRHELLFVGIFAKRKQFIETKTPPTFKQKPSHFQTKTLPLSNKKPPTFKQKPSHFQTETLPLSNKNPPTFKQKTSTFKQKTSHFQIKTLSLSNKKPSHFQIKNPPTFKQKNLPLSNRKPPTFKQKTSHFQSTLLLNILQLWALAATGTAAPREKMTCSDQMW